MEDSSTDVPADDERVIDGTGAAPGFAVGTAYRHEASAASVPRGTISPDEVDAELDRLANAVQRAEQELKTVRALAPDTLAADTDAIFEAQALMLRDEDVLRAVRRRIRDEKESAGAAVQAVLGAHRERLEESDDAHLRTGADDLLEVEQRLLRALGRSSAAARVDPQSVVVAEDLTATDLLRFGQHDLLGAVTAQGGTTSHAAIVARALGLPFLVGAEEAPAAVASGDRVLVDGTEGRLVVRPRPDTVEEYRRRRAEESSSPTDHAAGTAERPLQTADGHPVTLRANVGLEAELDRLRSGAADGIGLLRTELFLRAEGDPRSVPEERQVELYRTVAEAAGDEGATIRLLDLGGDQGLRRSTGEAEPPAVWGWRGLRRLLDRPDELLRPQLRALLRANREGALRVLLPMVTDVTEVERVRRMLDEESSRLRENGVPHDPDLPLGVMVEVPAAALQAPAFTEHVEFFSVGTNDLTQYVLAVGRDSDWGATRHDALHPAVLGLILRVVEAGRMAGCPVEVCGEIAGDVQAVPVLLGLGIDALSVSPPSLPAVRHIVRALEYDAAKELARDVLQTDDAQAARRRARAWVDAHLSSDGSASQTNGGPDASGVDR